MSASVAGWPDDLPVSAVRVARACANLDRSRAFYGDLLGLDLLFEFRDHDGYDGLVFGLPDRSVQLELVRRHEGQLPVPHPENALVLYLQDDGAALRRRLAPLVPLVVPENPYWSSRGAFAIDDPDGWQVLVAPASDLDEQDGPVRVEPFDEDRSLLLSSFRLAEDSETVLREHLGDGLVWVARGAHDEILGHAQAVTRDGGNTWEVLNLAVAEPHQGRGIGRLLIERVASEGRAAGAGRLVVATATADIGNLRFYQRCGLRMSHVVRDRFDKDGGYPVPIDIEGIPLRDQVWFDRDL